MKTALPVRACGCTIYRRGDHNQHRTREGVLLPYFLGAITFILSRHWPKDCPVYTPLCFHLTLRPSDGNEVCSLSSVILAVLCLKFSHALGSSNGWRGPILYKEIRLSSSSFSSYLDGYSLIIHLVTSTRKLCELVHYLVWVAPGGRNDFYSINFILSSHQPSCCAMNIQFFIFRNDYYNKIYFL